MQFHIRIHPMLRINEIFYSIQGESSFAGYPCVFVRMTGCNLRCTYCDTAYAYDEGQDMEIVQIIENVEKYPCRLIEITGGEPLIQIETPELVYQLITRGWTVLLETNGTCDISKLPAGCIRILDIKCPDSGESGKMDWDNIPLLYKRDEVKFVLSSRDDFFWACDVVDRYRLNDKHIVHFSPVVKKVNPQDLAEWLLKDNLNIRIHIQLHKWIWPDAKGK